MRIGKRIKVPLRIVENCKKFAIDCAPTIAEMLKKGGQKSVDAIIEQGKIGKIGEAAVYIYLKEKNRETTSIDYAVYEGNKKSWESDLKIKSENKKWINLAVKSQSTSSKKIFTLSWIFQNSKERRDKVLDKPESFIFFVEVLNETINEDGSVDCIICLLEQMKNLNLKEPRKQNLKNEKLVAYASDF